MGFMDIYYGTYPALSDKIKLCVLCAFVGDRFSSHSI